MNKPEGHVRLLGWRHKFGHVGFHMTFTALRPDELIQGRPAPPFRLLFSLLPGGAPPAPSPLGMEGGK